MENKEWQINKKIKKTLKMGNELNEYNKKREVEEIKLEILKQITEKWSEKN